MTQSRFLITVICEESVISHLEDNIRKFNPASYTIEKLSASKGGAESVQSCRIQIICKQALYLDIMSYIQQYYAKDYGVIYYMQEIQVPM